MAGIALALAGVLLLATEGRFGGRRGSPGRHSFDDSKLEPLQPIDLEASRLEMVEWFPEQMISLEAHRKEVEDALDRSHCGQLTAHVLQQQQATARPEDGALRSQLGSRPESSTEPT